MEYLILIIFVIGFVYFGYRDDFRRDKKNSTFSVFIVICALISFVLVSKINSILGLLSMYLVGFFGLKYKEKIIGLLFKA